MSKRILDIACGSKMFWFNKHNPDVEFCDNRTIPYHEYYPHCYIEISPDTVCDFTELPFPDESYKLVVFDPPHLTNAGDTSWTALKYGCLKGDWKTMIQNGFKEAFRVLERWSIDLQMVGGSNSAAGNFAAVSLSTAVWSQKR